MLLALACPVGATTGPWIANEHARVRLVAAPVEGGAKAGPENRPETGIDLGLEFELGPGWHVYWKNSGDAGYPPRLDFSRTPVLAGTHLLFPAPRRFDLPGGLVSFGYEERVLYPLAPRLAALGTEPLAVRARADYLVCRQECIPYSAELALDLAASASAGISTSPERSAAIARLAAAREALPRDPASVAGAPQVTLRVVPDPASAMTLELLASGGSLRAAEPDLFFEAHPIFALEKPELSVSGEGLRFRVSFRPLDETKPMPTTTTFAWTLTGLERPIPHGTGGDRPSPVALDGLASVEIPHLRTSAMPATPSADAIPNGLGISLLVAGVSLALFALHRFRNRRA